MDRIKLYLFRVSHIVVSVLLFYIFWVLFRYGRLSFCGPDRFRYNYYMAAMFCALMAFFGKTYNIYLLGYQRIRTLVISQAMSQILSVGICYVLSSLAWIKWLNPVMLIVLMGVFVIFDCIWSIYGNRLYFKLNPKLKGLLIYRNEIDRKRIMEMNCKSVGRVYTIEKAIRCAGSNFELLEEIIEDYDAVFVSGVDSTTRNGIAKYCVEMGVQGYFMPHIGDIIMRGANHIQSFSAPLLSVNRVKPGMDYLAVKRAIDIVASMAGLVFLSPMMLVIAICIFVEDGGNPIYKQTRLTLNGKEFKMYKFRSMRTDAEKDGVARLSTGEDDDRITKTGKILRMCRLDELPQLFNILVGDMSIVGPRPERPEIAQKIYEKLPEFNLRTQVKAGLTGYAQVYGKYNTEPYEKLEFDLLYINNMSLLTDIKLIFATLGILLKKESTEGVKKKSKFG